MRSVEKRAGFGSTIVTFFGNALQLGFVSGFPNGFYIHFRAAAPMSARSRSGSVCFGPSGAFALGLATWQHTMPQKEEFA